jgi:hypothetical protein
MSLDSGQRQLQETINLHRTAVAEVHRIAAAISGDRLPEDDLLVSHTAEQGALRSRVELTYRRHGAAIERAVVELGPGQSLTFRADEGRATEATLPTDEAWLSRLIEVWIGEDVQLTAHRR